MTEKNQKAQMRKKQERKEQKNKWIKTKTKRMIRKY